MLQDGFSAVKVLRKLLCQIWGHVLIFLSVVMENFDILSFKISHWIFFQSNLKLSSDWKCYLTLFRKEWSSVPENRAFEKLSVAYYSPGLLLCLSVCFSNYLSCLQLIFYQTSKHYYYYILASSSHFLIFLYNIFQRLLCPRGQVTLQLLPGSLFYLLCDMDPCWHAQHLTFYLQRWHFVPHHTS